ncbi:MAG: heme biosynthesis HemY N-terminal domain-containing protein [Arenimonas sp.]
MQEAALVAWALLWFLAWAAWTLLRLPFTAWQQLAHTQSRKRLFNGLLAMHEGRHARAAALLAKAAEDSATETVARLAAREAALRRGDLAGAALQLSALARREPLLAAIESAEALLAQGAGKAALDVLQPWQSLPPRALRLRGEALIASGRASEALPLLATLAREGEDAEALAVLEQRWQAAALTQSAHADELQQRWQALSASLREQPGLLRAYAVRAGALGLEAEAALALGEALERNWDQSLLPTYAELPTAREDARLARARSWLDAHPDSAALALALGQLCLRAQQLGPAEEVLTRAIAQGAGAPAWEELGHVYTARDDAARAQHCYANALRMLHGSAAIPLSGRSLREQIADEAVAEQRDELGLPRLRG